jgi:hypothetical protein
LTSGDISNLGVSAIDDYLYVRFTCNSATTLKPTLWNVSSCIDKTILIPIGEARRIPSSDKNVYRIFYDDIANYDLTVAWDNRYVGVSVYVASYCNFVTTAPDKLKTISVDKKSSKIVKSSEIDSWVNSIEADGLLYLRFNSTRAANVTFTSAKPAEQDPE